MDTMSVAERSRLMSKIHSEDTQPELSLRRLLHAAGYRFRLHGVFPLNQLHALERNHQEIRFRGGKLPGSPDLVFSARRKVIFVNGCFWLGHDCPSGANQPTSNTDYWSSKLRANIARDQRTKLELAILGWQSITIWECELKSMGEVLNKSTQFLGPPAMTHASASGNGHVRSHSG